MDLEPGLIVGLSAGGFVIVAGLAYLILRLRGPRKVPVYHVRCPDCGQKVSYVSNRAGREAKCPRCRRQILLPSTSQPLSKSKERMVPGTRKDGKEEKP